jgi:hypothetical protein
MLKYGLCAINGTAGSRSWAVAERAAKKSEIAVAVDTRNAVFRRLSINRRSSWYLIDFNFSHR